MDRKLLKKVVGKLSPQVLHKYTLRSTKRKKGAKSKSTKGKRCRMDVTSNNTNPMETSESLSEEQNSNSTTAMDAIEHPISDHEGSPLGNSQLGMISLIGSQQGASSNDPYSSMRKLSEEECESAEDINDRLQEIQSTLKEFSNLSGTPGLRSNIETIYEDIMNRNRKLMRIVTLNKIAGPYHGILRKITEEANTIKAKLLSTDEDIPHFRHRSNTASQAELPTCQRQSDEFRSNFARQLAASESEPLDIDVFQSDAQLESLQMRDADETLHDTETSGWQGWTSNEELQTRVQKLERRTQRIDEELKSKCDQQRTDASLASIEMEGSNLKKTVSEYRRKVDKIEEDLKCEVARLNSCNSKRDGRISSIEQRVSMDKIQNIQKDISDLKKSLKVIQENQSLKPDDVQKMIETAIQALRREMSNQTEIQSNAANPGVIPQESRLQELIENQAKRLDEEAFRIDALVEDSKEVRRKVNSVRIDFESTAARIATSTPLPNLVPSNSTTSSLGMDYVKRSIEKTLEKLDRNISVEVLETDDISIIRKRHTKDIPKVQKILEDLSKLMKEYLKTDLVDEDLYSKCLQMTDQAERWIQNVEILYEKWDIHTVDSEKQKSTTEVPVFNGDHTQTIFEFLDDFETAYLAIGSSKRRANMMHKKYLSVPIKSQTMHLADDYPKLKQYLIDNYGDALSVANTLIESLEALKKPSQYAYSDRLEFYLAISNILIRIERIQANPQGPLDKLKENMESRTIVERLRNLLPDIDEIKFIGLVREKGLDTKKLQGPFTLEVFRDFVSAQVDDMQRAVDRIAKTNPATKTKSKAAHSLAKNDSNSLEESDSDDEIGHPKISMNSSNAPKSWWRSGLRFPCPIKGHDHELGNCKEFFSQTPMERRANAKKSSRRICWCCLRPTAVCNKTCIQNVGISEVIKCQGCVEYATANKLAPLNVLYCVNPDHNACKPPAAQLHKELRKYLKGLDPSIVEDTLVYVNLGFVSLNALTCKCPKGNCNHKSQTKSSPVVPSSKPPIINTRTGEKEEKLDCEIKRSSTENAFFLMQWIKIGKSKCLVLFDRGSNVNLIDGALAERENLKVLDDSPSTLRVVGGEQVSTRYGKYSLVLGSKESGQYHEIECHGMEQVTTKFNKYSLDEINQELRREDHTIEKSEPLPVSIGGSVAHLLIGIKDIELDPKLLCTLQSGVGVFRSPFLDMNGSDICYAGPHPVFSRTDSSNGNQATLISMKALVEENLIDHGSEIPFSLVGGTENGIVHYSMPSKPVGELYPTPLTEDDFKDLGVETQAPGIEILLETKEEEDLAIFSDYAQAHLCSVNKAMIPISKMRELIDQDDINDSVSYRCPECSKCITCKQSSKKTATSIQDKVGENAIRKSVHIDQEKCEVWVELPFIEDPDEFLTKKFRDTSNYKQAHEVYKQQCKKPEHLKEGLRKVVKELKELDFVAKKTDLPKEQQDLINNGRFSHFHPWRTVAKEDSLSTSLRLVIDPTMTGLNLLLAKGENRLGKMNEIILRSRVSLFVWGTDISKMYNQLKMMPNSLRFQQFLYDETLDANVKPKEWVMTRAWYGEVPSGGQAGYAIEELTESNKHKHPNAVQPLTDARFVDDVWSPADSSKDREAQVEDTRSVLAKGGFSLKYIVKSGEAPPEKASSDGVTVKLLGYKYSTEEDLLSPGISELNVNKKIRGVRKPNTEPITSVGDAIRLLKATKITRRMVMAKIAEFYDPIGLFEPLKLQFKLGLTALNTFEWDEVLPEELQREWTENLAKIVEIPKIRVQRGVVPDGAAESKLRLICLSDAGEQAGGVVIYAGAKYPDGSYSCGMLTSKSRLIKSTIPRNELTAIMHMAELAFIVKRALGDKVEEIIYATDSAIALSWCHNTALKLRMFVHNRVETVRRLIQWTTDKEEIPLYHLAGNKNLADILTKPHEIQLEDVSKDSTWQKGSDWMKLPTNQLPLQSYEDLKTSSRQENEIKDECFTEPFFLANSSLHPLLVESANDGNPELTSFSTRTSNGGQQTINDTDNQSHLLSSGQRDAMLIDLVGMGWFRAIRVMSHVRKFIAKLKHKSQHSKISKREHDCMFCQATSESEQMEACEAEAEKDFFRYESRHIMKYQPKNKYQKYELKEGILYFSGRLTQENPFRFRDVDDIPFLDAGEIIGIVPVVLSDSPVFYSYLMAVHTRIFPHAGVMTTMKQISKKMLVLNAPKRVVAKVREDCIKCKIILKKTVELEMQKHDYPRTMIAPPFYNSMMDIAYGFQGQSYKNARKRFDVYALVVVCLLTGATSIMALEGLETQDIVQALERHSSRHGVPAEIFIDNGTQLKAMEHAEFSVSDVNAQTYDKLGLKISVSNPKAHEERGRVERRIGMLRVMLERMLIGSHTAQTALQWETLFAKIANTIDDLPLAKGNTSNESNIGYEILTANRIKLGRNNNRTLAGSGMSLMLSSNLTRILEKNRLIYQTWYQLFIDHIHLLSLKPAKWDTTGRLPKVDDTVLFVFLDSGYGKRDKSWKLGRVVQTSPTKVEIEYYIKSEKGGKMKPKTLTRSPRDISILFSLDELFINSREHFQNLFHEE